MQQFKYKYLYEAQNIRKFEYLCTLQIKELAYNAHSSVHRAQCTEFRVHSSLNHGLANFTIITFLDIQ